MRARRRVGLTHRFLAWRVLHQSLASRRLLNFIGGMSGPVTMKSSRTRRMVSVVIAPPCPNDRTKAEARIEHSDYEERDNQHHAA